MHQTQTINTAACPECDARVAVNDPLLGELVTCTACSTELEVRVLAPLTLAPAPQVQEDWGE